MWLLKWLYDYFAAVGFLSVTFMIVAIVFHDGAVKDFNTGFIFLPALIFAWLRGEFYHWPRERGGK